MYYGSHDGLKMNPVIERSFTSGGNDLRDAARTSSLTEIPNKYMFSESWDQALDSKYHFSYFPTTQLRAQTLEDSVSFCPN